jgi:hypothetical protein
LIQSGPFYTERLLEKARSKKDGENCCKGASNHVNVNELRAFRKKVLHLCEKHFLRTLNFV